ncbi:MAG TPA: RodZ domain-containing protein [Candidatus Sulfopaludibacter sp.]|nr:RodZ domain-containing protein [Candidatus Sulfopaludibacter sp.]
MIAIGETLRRERQRRNLDLETISRELKISPKMLSAIEEEQFDRLPGGVFAKAFVRQYAHLLGLDEEEMANEVQRILEPPPDVPQFAEANRPAAPPIQVPRVEEWETVGDRRFRWSSPLTALGLVVVVMLGCAGVYSLWQRSRRAVSAHEATAPAAPAPVAQQPPAQQPPAQPASPAPMQPADQTAAAPASRPVETEAAAQAPAATTEAKPAASSPEKTAADKAPVSNPNAPVRVELVAEETVWVLARSDGKYLFSGTMEANQTRTVEANSTVLLRLGNAGGVSITLNGKPIGAVGPKGQVRTVQLTSGGFEIVAVPKAPSVPLDPLR